MNTNCIRIAILQYTYIYISADPALAKAGAAPGTTAGVELFFFPNALRFPRATQAIALWSPPRSRSGHSNFCPLPTGHSCSNLGFCGVPRRNRPRQTLCSSNKSLRPWQCPFKEVQGCRLPGFKTRQSSPNASLQLPGATQAAVNLSCSSTSP